MKVTTATINDGPHQLIKDFAAAVERDFAADQVRSLSREPLGSVPRQIEGVQFGSIQAVAYHRIYRGCRRTVRGDGGSGPCRFF